MNTNDQRFIAQKIRSQYTERTSTELDALRALDSKVKNPPRILAYILGVLGALVLGTGMCLAMKILGDATVLGVAVGCVGILLVSVNYPLYKKLLASRKKRYAGDILALSEKIMGEN